MERTVLIHNLLKEIEEKKKRYSKKEYQLKKLEDVSEAIITALSSIGVTVNIVSLTTMNPILLIMGTVLCASSTVLSAIKKTLNIQSKYQSVKTTHNQLSDLLLESKIIITRNHLSSDDKKELLDNLKNKLSLIEDSALPISGK